MNSQRVKSSEGETRRLICEFLSLFYDKGWVTGTGGGICASIGEGRVLMAPTGVHKERVAPSDLFVVDPVSGAVIRSAKNRTLCLSECGPIFCEIINRRGAGAVMHTHSLWTLLAADLVPDAEALVLSGMEMLKGIDGATNADHHRVPIVVNTARERELTAQVVRVCEKKEYEKSYCLLVRDHGAYIWGRDLWEAKRHAEVYHFLFEGTVARARMRG